MSNPMEQLIGFVEFDKQQNPGKTHIAEWALGEIYRLSDAIEAARKEGYAACFKGVDAFTDATNAEVRDLRRQLAAAQATIAALIAAGDILIAAKEIDSGTFSGCAKSFAEILAAQKAYDAVCAQADTTALDALLAARERETIERCAHEGWMAASSGCEDRVRAAIRDLLPKDAK